MANTCQVLAQARVRVGRKLQRTAGIAAAAMAMPKPKLIRIMRSYSWLLHDAVELRIVEATDGCLSKTSLPVTPECHGSPPKLALQ